MVWRSSPEREPERAPCLRGDMAGGGGDAAAGRGRRVVVDVLLAGWGLAAWLGVNGLYIELPVLVRALPEGWALGAAMALAVQLANLGLLLYAALRRLIPRLPDSAYIYALLLINVLALALNAGLYDRTVLIGSSERSVAFLALTFCVALVGCTSSVLFYPYLRHFREIYLATYLAGEGLSGFLPALLALAQGAGGEARCEGGVAEYPAPRFGVPVFLSLLAGLGGLSLVSFAGLSCSETARGERLPPAVHAKEEEAAPRPSLLSARWLAVLVLCVVLNGLTNGVLPSVQSYACMPYGVQAYHLAVSLGALATPAACLVGVWARPVSARALGGLLSALLLPLALVLAAALLSPTPPLAGSGGGAALVVVSWVATAAGLAYCRMWVYGWARAGGAAGMRAAGVATQFGSALASALMFVLVNYTALFTQADPCPTHL